MCNKDKVEGKYYFELKDELDMKRAETEDPGLLVELNREISGTCNQNRVSQNQNNN